MPLCGAPLFYPVDESPRYPRKTGHGALRQMAFRLDASKGIPHNPSMLSIQRILVGFDFSTRCQQTLQRAGALAKSWGATLSVLHVLPEVPYEGASQNVDLVDWMGKLGSEVSAELESQVGQLLPSGIEVESLIRTGDPTEEILEFAVEKQVQLILVGSESHSGLEDLLWGRTCEGVLQNTTVPLWVERGEGLSELKTLLLPTDLSANSRPALEAGLQWAKQFKAKACILHVVEVPFVPPFSMMNPKHYEETIAPLGKQQFEEFVTTLPTDGVEVETLLTYGDPAGEVERYAHDLSASLVVFSTPGRTGRNVQRHPGIPLLFIPH